MGKRYMRIIIDSLCNVVMESRGLPGAVNKLIRQPQNMGKRIVPPKVLDRYTFFLGLSRGHIIRITDLPLNVPATIIYQAIKRHVRRH